MTVKPLIKLENIILRRGKARVLDIDSLQISAGKILALIGPNGAGKSSLLLTLAGLLKPQQGSFIFQEKRVQSSADRLRLRREASVVFQDALLLDTTVCENVALGLKLRGKKKEEVITHTRQALDYFGINHLAQRSAKKLSGGEAKRASLARAFALKPQLLLLDEPFNSLDPQARESIIDDLKHILEETRITAVMALHDRDETLRLAENVAVISEGKIIQIGRTLEVFNKPADEFIANFVGTESILEGRVTDSKKGIITINVNNKIIEAAGDFMVGEEVYCCLRPENITVAGERQEKISARNIYPAKVNKIIQQRVFYKLNLDCGFPLVAYITKPSFEDLNIEENKEIFASFKATAVHVIRKEK